MLDLEFSDLQKNRNMVAVGAMNVMVTVNILINKTG